MSERPASDSEATQVSAMSASEVLDLAYLCACVYGRGHEHPSGWSPLALSELHLEAFGGRDAAFTDYVCGNAAAFVRVCEREGVRTLAVVFRGTDGVQDIMDDLVSMRRHWRHLQRLSEAVHTYACEHGIERVLVAGHSLGGSMAETMMECLPDPDPGIAGPRYMGVTFGAPRSSCLHARGRDDRLLEICHERDFVPQLAARDPLHRYHVPGRVLMVHDPVHRQGLMGRITAHRMPSYIATVAAMCRKGWMEAVLAGMHGHTMLRVDMAALSQVDKAQVGQRISEPTPVMCP